MALRQKVWIDGEVQGVLVGRVLIYWAFAMLYVGLGTICFQYYANPEWSVQQHASFLFSQFWPWIPSAILCLPLVVFDVIRLSNLFVGPVYRLRNHLLELNADPNCTPIKFRSDDYWQDLAEPIHRLQFEILSLRAELAKQRRANPSAIPGDGVDSAPHDRTPLKSGLPPIGAISPNFVI